ncbi:MAG TPA: hypothetical protein VL093_06620 [Flavipsychrobacter sp.]|nr:hypothetical protein [Flavipsychrobacter sp.]
MRFLFLLLFLFLLTVSAKAQSRASASQRIQLVLNPIIDIKFSEADADQGAMVTMPFNTVHQYKDGVFSGTQELEVRSNKNFKISVQTDASNFQYSGATNGASMPVDNTLFMSVVNNNTGGIVNGPFDNSYHSLSSAAQDVILNGRNGEEKRLALAYMAKPDMSYPSGIYSVGVIYTATQP